MPKKKLDQLEPGDFVLLAFAAENEERAVFLKMTGEGDDRRATFLQFRNDGSYYEWDAYRYSGRWAYGSSADVLRLLEVL